MVCGQSGWAGPIRGLAEVALVDALHELLSDPDATGGGFVAQARQNPIDSSTGGSEDCLDPELGQSDFVAVVLSSARLRASGADFG